MTPRYFFTYTLYVIVPSNCMQLTTNLYKSYLMLFSSKGVFKKAFSTSTSFVYVIFEGSLDLI